MWFVRINFQKQFSIEGIREHPIDLISVLCIVEEIEALHYNLILFCKQQGEQPTEVSKALTEQDFLLVIQQSFKERCL